MSANNILIFLTLISLICTSIQPIDDNCKEAHFQKYRIINPPTSLMYRLCKLNSSPTYQDIETCSTWFQTTINHCAGMLRVNNSHIPVLVRLVSWMIPSLKKLEDCDDVTEYNPIALSEFECKLLLLRIAQDYVTRQPHNELILTTLNTLWTSSCLVMATMLLIITSILFYRIYFKFMHPYFNMRERSLEYLNDCATEVGAANYEALVTVNKLMEVAKFETRHLHVQRTMVMNFVKDI